MVELVQWLTPLCTPLIGDLPGNAGVGDIVWSAWGHAAAGNAAGVELATLPEHKRVMTFY